MNASSVDQNPSGLSKRLAITFCVTMIMGTGPGVALVNRPETFLGVPLIYAWAVFWYMVQIGVALIACLFAWHDDTDAANAESGELS